MINEIRYENPMSSIDFSLPTVFLAGCTVRGYQTHLKSWRPDAIELFRKYGFVGNIIIPEFSSVIQSFIVDAVSDKYRSDLPAWEFEGLRKSMVIMFWIPRTEELIGLTTNYEFGYWTAKCRNKVIYGRPDDAYRIKYCDIMWYEDGKVNDPNNQNYPIYNTLEKTVRAVMEKMKDE